MGREGLVHHQYIRVGRQFRDHPAAPNQGRQPLARDIGLKEPPPPNTLAAEAAPSQAREVCHQWGGRGWCTTSIPGSVDNSVIIPLPPTRVVDH